MGNRIILDNDGGDALHCGEGSYEAFTAMRLNRIARSGLHTLFYTTHSAGFSVMTYHTKIGSVRDKRTSRHPQNAVADMLSRGTDCLEYTIRFCRGNGINIFWEMRMNDIHDAARDPIMLECNRFKKEHPDCLLGSKDNRPTNGAWTAVNYEREEVRNTARLLVEEVCQNYDIDGVCLDFYRHPVFFPNPANNLPATPENIEVLNALMRDIYKVLVREGKQRGKAIPLAVRIPDSVEFCRILGFDIETWLREGLVKMLVTSGYQQFNAWEYTAELAHKYGAEAYPSLDEPRILSDKEACARRWTVATMRGRASNALLSGCDGLLLFNYISGPEPKERYGVISEIANPEFLHKLNKTFFASVRGSSKVNGRMPAFGGYFNIPTLTPDCPEVVKTSAELPIRVMDTWEGKVTIELWFTMSHSSRIFLNGYDLGLHGEPYIKLTVPFGVMCIGDNTVKIEASEPVVWLDACINFE